MPSVRTVGCHGILGSDAIPLYPKDPNSFASRDLKWTTDLLVFITHAESPKVLSLLNNSNVEAVWYFDGSTHQYRIRGRMHMVLDVNHPTYKLSCLSLDLAKALYFPAEPDQANMPAETPSAPAVDLEWVRRETFKLTNPQVINWLANSHPGLPKSNTPLLAGEPIGDSSPAEDIHSRALLNYVLLLLEPSRIDYIDLASDERIVFTLETGHSDGSGPIWKETAVNP
ncbi:hypothetical protein EV182_005000 [Spiromyces aspiralis]|uniref:Uncharacterized protein n=1 Tax=Spiromyces aspiralis TaxID=68401 RepID=A0ACC1HC33_9FUNG|nr:hypothetical protein EV182_005000 [Spiromyces aspiralis]